WAITRYHAESQRAAGAASRSPSQPKPLVTPGGLKAVRTGPKPKAAIVARAALHTSTRDPARARALTRTAAILAGSARNRVHQPNAPPARPGIENRGSTAAASSLGASRMMSSAASEFMARDTEPRDSWDGTGRRPRPCTVISVSRDVSTSTTAAAQGWRLEVPVARRRRGPDRRAHRRALRDRLRRARRAHDARPRCPSREGGRRHLASVRGRWDAAGLHPIRRTAHARGMERNPNEPQECDRRDRGPALLQRRRHRC